MWPVRRVTLCAPGVFEPGGAAKHALKIANGLAVRGWDVTVVSRARRDARPHWRHIDAIRVVQPPSFGIRWLDGPVFVLCALAVALARRRDGVYVGLQLLSPFTAAALAGVIGRRPFFGFSFSSGLISEIAVGRDTRTWPVRRWLLRRATGIVAQTAYAADEIQRSAPGADVRVIPNPVDGDEPQPLTGDPFVLAVGRLTSEKGLDDLLDAWPTVTQRLPAGAMLRIAGNGDGPRNVEPQLHARVAGDPLLTPSVEFLGWTDDVSAALDAADVYAHPSTSEGMSNSLLEACAAGRVVVASAIPGNIEVLGPDYPLLHRPADSEDLAEKLIWALTDEDRRKRAVSAIERRIARFHSGPVIDAIGSMLSARPPFQ
jgi:glycosyltransferase involved in cell wall biosynthesis